VLSRTFPFTALLFAVGCQGIIGLESDRKTTVATDDAGHADGSIPRENGPIQTAPADAGADATLSADAAVEAASPTGIDAGPDARWTDDPNAGPIDFGTACHPDDPFGPVLPLTELSSPVAVEWNARLTPDELRIYFSRSAPGNKDALYFAKRETRDAPFGAPENLLPPSTFKEAKERNPSVTADDRTLFFDGYDPIRAIHVARRASPDVPFVDSLPLQLLSGGHEELMPYVLPDGSALYFTSGTPFFRPEHEGTFFHIWRSALVNGKYAHAEPVEVDPNPEFESQSAVVTADERILYFAHTDDDGSPHDIWVATRRDRTKPFATKRRVAELKTPDFEFPSFLSPDACRLYFVRGPNVVTDLDLYVAKRTPRAR
jgi:hypothetical protein